MENTASIYSKQNSKIRQILEQAGSPAKVLCVALDYAKAKHVVLFCNGFGDIVKKPFPVDNSTNGLNKLLAELRSTCAHRNISQKHVFFGGEDNPPYVQNFIHELSVKGFVVARVNAWEAKQQRDNHQASTDQIDVRAIAKTLLNKTSYCDQDQPDIFQALRETSRTRANFVAQLSEQKFQIHHYACRLFPGFLDPKQSGIDPFSQPSLALLAESFSAERIRRWRQDGLVGFLQRHGQDEPVAAAQQLKALAAQVLAPAPHMVACWQSSLSQYLRQHQALQQSIDCLDKELAHCLAQSPAALLTSISGIGIVLAAGIVSELGCPKSWRALRFLCSYCGIVPRIAQTGGPDKPARTGTVQRRCNRRAKNWLVQAGSMMGRCGPAELKSQHQQLKLKGQHADFIMGKRLLRIFKDLLRRSTVYRPKHLLAQETPNPELIAYYLKLWDHLRDKWSRHSQWDTLVDPLYPLGQWRQMVQQLYKISLPLPKKGPGKATK